MYRYYVIFSYRVPLNPRIPLSTQEHEGLEIHARVAQQGDDLPIREPYRLRRRGWYRSRRALPPGKLAKRFNDTDVVKEYQAFKDDPEPPSEGREWRLLYHPRVV